MFTIPKKSGARRRIISPNKSLKNIQRTLNIILQSIYTPMKSAHGFVNNRSIVSNANKHINKNYVYNIDLEDFFPSIHQLRIWKRLQLPPYNMTNEISDLISNLVCYQYDKSKTKQQFNNDTNKNFLPQGAPTSPTISNMICERLDKRLLGVAKRFNLTYTRYADDITFSSNHNVYQTNSEFIKELHRVIENENFTINKKKTRLQKNDTRQEVTGLIVNEKLNVPRKYIKALRMLIHILEKYGINKSKDIYNNYNSDINKKHFLASAEVIKGKLEYLKMIKGEDNSTYLTLKKRFDDCFITTMPYTQQLLTTYESKKLALHNPIKMIEFIESIKDNDKLSLLDITTTKNKDYKALMRKLKKQWKSIRNQYSKVVNVNLLAKVYAFIFDTNIVINGWGINRNEIGLSSSKLIEWIKKNPNKYISEYSTEFDNKTLKDYLDILYDEFSISPDKNNLFEIFSNQLEVHKRNNIEILFTKEAKDILSNTSLAFDRQILNTIINNLVDFIFFVNTLNIDVKENIDSIEIYFKLISRNDINIDLNDSCNYQRNSLYKLIKSMYCNCDFRVHSIKDNNPIVKNILGIYDDLIIGTNTHKFTSNTYVLKLYKKVIEDEYILGDDIFIDIPDI